MTSGRFALRQAFTAQAAQRSSWTRSTRPLSDDALKASYVERHRERVLGRRRRKADKEAADRLQFAGQLAGIGRHQRPCAGLGQRRRDGERRASIAARGDGRDDLENGSAGERRCRPAPRAGEGASVARWRAAPQTGERASGGRPDLARCSRQARFAVSGARGCPSAASSMCRRTAAVTVGKASTTGVVARRRAPVRNGGPGVRRLSDIDPTWTGPRRPRSTAKPMGWPRLRFDYFDVRLRRARG